MWKTQTKKSHAIQIFGTIFQLGSKIWVSGWSQIKLQFRLKSIVFISEDIGDWKSAHICLELIQEKKGRGWDDSTKTMWVSNMKGKESWKIVMGVCAKKKKWLGLDRKDSSVLLQRNTLTAWVGLTIGRSHVVRNLLPLTPAMRDLTVHKVLMR